MISNFLNNTEKVAGKMELLKLKEDQALQTLHKSYMIKFWKLVPEPKHLNLKKAVWYLFSIFGTIYSCESL